MRFLLDTHLILWAASSPQRLSSTARTILYDPESDLLFSPVSLWEVAIKRNLRRNDFQVDPLLLFRGLVASGYRELPVRSEHAIAAGDLPPLHKDPFDRMLVAQSLVDGVTLLTSDPVVARYSESIRTA